MTTETNIDLSPAPAISTLAYQGEGSGDIPLPTVGAGSETTWTLANVKATRKVLLLSTDWTQAADSPLSDEKKAEFATYRQALRDITDGELSQIEDFPKPPSA